MNTVNRTARLSVLAIALSLAACGKSEAPAASSAAPAAVQAAATAATPSPAPKKAADGNTEREQGTMQVDAGQGMQSLRSMATVIDPKLGEKTAARLGTAQGQQKLADANSSVPSSMGQPEAPKVTSSEIQNMANKFAGRTVYSSQAMHAEIINGYSIDLDAKSPSLPGVRMNISLTVSDTDLTLKRAKLEYYPDASKQTQSYVKKNVALSDITLDKLERKDDNTFVIAGSFKATDLAPGVLAKELAGKTLASVSGRFDFSEVPIRKIGN